MKIESSLDGEIMGLLRGNRSLQKLYRDFSSSREFKDACEAANKLVVDRLGYNDHGIVHAKIVARNALKIYQLLEKAGIGGNYVTEGSGNSEDVKLILLLSSLLHDVGNAIHRKEHFMHSTIIGANMLEEYDISPRKKIAIQECIYAHDDSIEATSIEASILKIADALDMEEGRARIPFRMGNMDIHTVSALAIRKIEVLEGKQKPVLLKILMSCVSGIFQVQEMLVRQVRQGKMADLVELQVEMAPESTCGAKIGPIINKRIM
ncbi:MAG: HD domain-containing protein [Candidatus Micrarchaeota archaeon]